MNKNSYFNVLFKRAKSEQEIKKALKRISKLKHINRETDEIIEDFHAFLKEKDFDEHFEIVYDLSRESEKEVYLTKISKLFDTTKSALNKDYKTYCAIIKQQKKLKRHKAFANYIKKSFALDYTPSIEAEYNHDSNILTHQFKDDTSKLCNLFVPVAKIESEINGAKRTHIKLHMKYKGQTVEIVESSRKFLKGDKLNDIFGDHGFFVDNFRASKISKFIADFLLDNQYKIKEEYGRSQTGWKDGIFYIPQREQSVVWLENNLKNAYKTKGSLEKQKELLKEMAKGKIFIPVLGAFASVLFGLVSIKNFIIHLGGLTGEGKTVGVEAALSFFGNPSSMGTNWNATLNGLETYWEQNHSMPMWVDEMEVTSKLEEIVSAIYTFTDGHGKNRAFSDGEDIKQRKLKTFKGICFSTGEKSFLEVQNTIRNRIKPRGGTRRVVDLNILNLWKNVDVLRCESLAEENQGHLGIKYVEFVEANQEHIKNDFKNHISFFKGLGLKGGVEKQYAIFKLTLHILHSMNFLSNDELDLQIELLKEMAIESKEKYNIIKDVYEEFKNTFTEFVLTNLAHFDYQEDGKTYWTSHEKEPYYGKVDFNSNVIDIFPKALERWCTDNGFVKLQVLETLMKNKKLQVNKGREKYFDKTVRINSTQAKVHQMKGLFDRDIKIDIVKKEDQKNDETVVAPANINVDEIPKDMQSELDFYK